MKAEYARLSRTLAIVTWERDLAVKEKHQLQAKLENLEQVLKVGGCPCPLLLRPAREAEPSDPRISGPSRRPPLLWCGIHG